MARARPDEPAQDLTPIAFEVLLSLAGGPLHGYGIKLAVEARTEGELVLGSGTLYQAITRGEPPTVVSFVTVLIVNFLLTHMIVDLLYAALDPRIRYP